jgi:hypothetical protein
MLHSLGVTLHARYKHVTLVGRYVAHLLKIWHTRWALHCTRVTNISHSLGVTLHMRYKYGTLAGHIVAHALQRWHTRWALHCTRVTNMLHSLGVTLHTRSKFGTLAEHHIAHALQICHTRFGQSNVILSAPSNLPPGSTQWIGVSVACSLPLNTLHV